MSLPLPTLTCTVCDRAIASLRLRGVCASCLVRGAKSAGAAETKTETETEGDAASLLQIPGHRVLGEIARGGMGIVYRARQLQPEREVALKMLLPGAATPAMRERFRNEARTMAELEHHGVLPIYQFGEYGGTPWFTMKLARGGSLADRLKAPFPPAKAAGLVALIADAVAYAHLHGVLHRDLKPGNILFDADDSPFVADFGLAKLDTYSEIGLTQSRTLLGTPHYLAPELVEKSAATATVASDVYALGTILYELLAGVPAFRSESLAGLLRSIAEDEPPPLPARNSPGGPLIDRSLSAITGKAMARDPARRYTGAAALAEDLRAWSSGQPILAKPPGQWQKTVRWVRRHPASSAALLALSFGMAGIAFSQAQAARRLRASAENLAVQEAALTCKRSELEGLMSFVSNEVASTVEPLGRLDMLAPLMKKAVDYYQTNPPAADDRERQARHYRALLLMGNVQADRWEGSAAVGSYQQSLEIVTRMLQGTGNQPHLVRLQQLLLRSMSDASLGQGKLPEAEAYARQALIHAEQSLKETPDSAIPSRMMVVTLRSLAAALGAQGQHAGADVLAHRSAGIAETWMNKVPGNPDWMKEGAACELNLGEIARREQRWTDAARHFERQISLIRTVTTGSRSAVDRYPLAVGLTALASARRELGDLENSAANAREALALARELAHQDPMNAEWQIGFIEALRQSGLTAQGREGPETAIGYLDRARLFTSNLRDQHPEHAALHRLLALLEADVHPFQTNVWSPDQWIMAFDAALASGDVSASLTTSTVGYFVEHAGKKLIAAKRLGEALDLYRRAAARVVPATAQEIAFQGLRWEAAFYANRQAEVLEQQGKLEEALAQFRKAQAWRQDHLIANSTIKGGGRVVSSIGHVTRVLTSLGRTSDIITMLDEALDFFDSKKLLDRKEPADVAPVLIEMIVSLVERAPSSAARAEFISALPRWRARFFRTAPRPAETVLLEKLDAAARQRS
jgi:tetratricopeptide (TPR) repeat protein